MNLKTWTKKSFDDMADSVIEQSIGSLPNADQKAENFNMDSLDLLEIISELETELETEFDLTEFNKNLLDLPWSELKKQLRKELKVNGYIILVEE